jgi:hypothetical protein
MRLDPAEVMVKGLGIHSPGFSGMMTEQSKAKSNAPVIDCWPRRWKGEVASSRWVNDRAGPLGQILRDTDAFRLDDYDLLHALVAKHLEKFDGDPWTSLQQLGYAGSLRDDLASYLDLMTNRLVMSDRCRAPLDSIPGDLLKHRASART